MTGSATRVLHTFAPAPFGGAEAVVRSLAASQAAAGHMVSVAAVLDPDAGEHPVVTDLEANGVAVRQVRPPARGYLAERREISNVCASVRPDVVHTHGYRADVLHSGVARRRGIATVSTVHGFTRGDWKNRLYEWLQRRAYRNFHAVVPVSAPLERELAAAGVPEDHLHIIRNAWAGTAEPLSEAEARSRLNLQGEGPWVGYVGRVGPEKGADIFIRSLARLRGQWNAVVIGEGRIRQDLQLQAEELGISGRVQWAGFVPEAGRYMKALDVFVLSSRTEGTPIALFEAMAAGVPVVATRVGGVPDVVSDREAVLVPPEEPDALAAAIHEVLGDPRAADHRAHGARQRLRTEFGPEAWVEQYDRVYGAAMARARERSGS